MLGDREEVVGARHRLVVRVKCVGLVAVEPDIGVDTRRIGTHQPQGFGLRSGHDKRAAICRIRAGKGRRASVVLPAASALEVSAAWIWE